MRNRFATALIAVKFCLAIFASTIVAHPLADQVPGDAIVYVAWKGYATPGSGYAGSHLQSVLQAAQAEKLINEELPKLMTLLAEDDAAEMKKGVETALAIAAPLLRNPTAFFLRPSDDPKDPVRAGIICRAGADTKALADKLRGLLAQNARDADEFQVIESGDLVRVFIGYSDAEVKAAAAAPTPALAADAKLNAAAKVAASADPYLVFYANIEAGMALMDRKIAPQGAENVEKWFKARDSLGLDGLHRMYVSGNFTGKDWSSTLFVEAPAPRKGLIKLFEGRSVEKEFLKMIPATAGSAHLMRFDLAAFVNEVRNVFIAADPDEGGANFDRGVGAAQMALAAHPINDFVAPMGDTWLFFSDDSIAGNSKQGLVAINKLDDAAAAAKGFNAVWSFASNMIAARGVDEVKVGSQKFQNIEVKTIQIATVSFGWTIANDRLVVGLNPEGVAKAAAAPAPAKGFDQNAQFNQISSQLAKGQEITSFSFTDLPVTAPLMYAEHQREWADARTLLEGQDIKLPESLFPPFEALKPHLSTPMASVAWADEGGLHVRTASPFFGAEAFSNAQTVASPELMLVGSTGVGVAILLPSLNRARETANRVACASNERQIAQAILLYSNDHDGNYPPDLGTLILQENVTIRTFVCPSGDNRVPGNADDMTPQQQADWANQHGDYVFSGKGLKIDAPAEKIILYEKPDNHDRDGINFTYADGHVEFHVMSEAEKLIEQLRDK